MSAYRKTLYPLFLIGILLLQAGCHRDQKNVAPTVVLAAAQISNELPTTFAFSSIGTADNDGEITSYTWNFGDGTTSSEPSPTHSFAASGSFPVTLTVTDNDGASASQSRTVEITTPAASVSVAATAATVSLPQVATVSLPDGAFSTATRVGIWTTESSETAADFDTTAEMFKLPLRAKQEIRINTGKVQVEKTVSVAAHIPAELAARLQASDELKVFVQIFQAGGEEVIDNFELVPAVLEAASNTVRFDLLPGMFSNRRNNSETWEAVIVVGTTHTKPQPVLHSSTLNVPASVPLQIEQIRSWPLLAASGIANEGFPSAAADDDATCDGSTLQPPLTDLAVFSAFNPPAHHGTDYVAKDGTDIFSMAKGKVFKVGFQEDPLKKADPRSGKMVKGWGKYVIVEHEDGSKSLYAHLQTAGVKVKAGDPVEAGTLLALSDNSGGSSGPHLHVEYAPNGEIFKRDGKVDPAACIGNTTKGNLLVRDNGAAADDAFAVAINGKQICTTTVGASNNCSLGALRAGSVSLTITATIAPDDVGTYEIVLSGGLTFQDGSLTVSGTLAQGKSASFELTVQ